MLDMLTGLSVGAPRGNGAQQALDAAADGNTGHLEGLQAGVSRVMKSWTAEKLSQGLHASTLCADMPAPWGDASAPLEGASRHSTASGEAHEATSTPTTARPRPGTASRSSA